MLNINLIRVILTILAENGETRTLTLVKLINSYTDNIRVKEPIVFEHYITKNHEVEANFDGVIIDWGDGTITNTTAHRYNNLPGKYRVKIQSDLREKFKISIISIWSDDITDFITIGRIGITSLASMFFDSNFNGKIHPNWDVSKITDMSYMFAYLHYFNQKIGDNWDTQNVRNMSRMFYATHNFNQKIGDNWDTKNVRNMSHMFYEAHDFNQKIGDNWDTQNVRNMSWMFCKALSFNQKIGDNWDTSNVMDMSYMFLYSRLNQKIGENWITIQAIMYSMFPYGYDPNYLPKWYKNMY